jgi:hypothetical protein
VGPRRKSGGLSPASTAAAQVLFQVSSCGICGGQNDTGVGVLRSTSTSPDNSHYINITTVRGALWSQYWLRREVTEEGKEKTDIMWLSVSVRAAVIR